MFHMPKSDDASWGLFSDRGNPEGPCGNLAHFFYNQQHIWWASSSCNFLLEPFSVIAKHHRRCCYCFICWTLGRNYWKEWGCVLGPSFIQRWEVHWAPENCIPDSAVKMNILIAVEILRSMCYTRRKRENVPEQCLNTLLTSTSCLLGQTGPRVSWLDQFNLSVP